MKHNHFDQQIFGNMEMMPWQKLMELNIKTIQHMSFMKPGDLLEIRKPEDFFAKNINMMIHNSHTAINHMQDALHIVESHLSNVSHNSVENTADVMRHTSTVAQKAVKKTVSTAKKTAKKMASSVKASSKAVAKVASKATPKAAVKAASKVARKAAPKKAASKVALKAAPKAASKVAHKAAPKKAASKVALKAAPKAASKVAHKAAPKKAASKVAHKAAPKAAFKTNMKKTAKVATKPMVQHNKPHVAQQVKHDNMHAKTMGHNMPKVGGIAEKSDIKDLGLLNKGSNFHN